MSLTEQQRNDIKWMRETNFREGVERHYASPPDTWRVQKAHDQDWRIVDVTGVHVSYVWSYPTRKAALADIDPANKYSTPRRMWTARSEWYEGRSNDPRSRALEPWEEVIVADVLQQIARRQEAANDPA